MGAAGAAAAAAESPLAASWKLWKAMPASFESEFSVTSSEAVSAPSGTALPSTTIRP